MKTIVLGLGNPILSDDGIGLLIAETLIRKIKNPEITVETTCLGGLNLLELLTGYDKALIIDAIQTGENEPGQIYRLHPYSLLQARHTSSTHGISFYNTIKLGKGLGMKLPEEIVIYAVEAEDVNTFGERCSSHVKRAIPKCVKQILEELNQQGC